MRARSAQVQSGEAPARAELYARLPVLESDRWWLDRAREAPGERVLELGAGAGRLTCAMAATGVHVTAIERDPVMAAKLRDRVARSDANVEVVEADAAARRPALAGGFGLVVLASSLINEVGDAQVRRDLLAAARRACRSDGQVALQVLGPWWLTGMPEHSTGELTPMGGGPPVTVDIERAGCAAASGRRQARLTYRFPEGDALVDDLDAAVITATELDRLLADAALEPTGRWGGRPPDPARESDPVWHVLARPS
jgi:SAM-dependent methyltransferase